MSRTVRARVPGLNLMLGLGTSLVFLVLVLAGRSYFSDSPILILLMFLVVLAAQFVSLLAANAKDIDHRLHGFHMAEYAMAEAAQKKHNWWQRGIALMVGGAGGGIGFVVGTYLKTVGVLLRFLLPLSLASFYAIKVTTASTLHGLVGFQQFLVKNWLLFAGLLLLWTLLIQPVITLVALFEVFKHEGDDHHNGRDEEGSFLGKLVRGLAGLTGRMMLNLLGSQAFCAVPAMVLSFFAWHGLLLGFGLTSMFGA